ncbi:MAG: YggS family pyridoxal phosphate-dependent enzyme [Myxococcales bacterium]|nr:YggS family pyridoxal phosphate-dependent enzyme [Myxococcales bacterium]
MDVATRLADVHDGIAAAARASGRDPREITLVAVSKRKPAAMIRAAYAAGQRDFGENYAQELRDKARELEDLDALRWHFIGPFQSNKARLLVGRATLLHSVSEQRHLEAVAARAQSIGVEQRVLVQLNLSGESTKHGVAGATLAALLRASETLEGVRIEGLMTMPPADDDDVTARCFAELRVLRDAHGGVQRLPQLSMGMSHDYALAIAHGSTCVRVGTAIFGSR